MSKLTPKIWHAIFTWNTYSVVAQELPSNPGFCRWAGLHILSHYPDSPRNYWFIKESQGFAFCLIIFELEKRILEYSDGINSDEIKNPEVYMMNKEEELYAICATQMIEAAKFSPPWQSRYPFD